MQNRECPYCFAAAPEDALFCPECGKPMKKVRRRDRELLPQRCARCGAVLSADSAGCAYCGEGEPNNNWVMRKKRRLPLILALAILLLWGGIYTASTCFKQWNSYESGRLYITGREEGPIPCVVYMRQEGSRKYITRMDLPYGVRVKDLHAAMDRITRTELTVNGIEVSFQMDVTPKSRSVLKEYGNADSDLFFASKGGAFYHDILCSRAAETGENKRLYFSSAEAAELFGFEPCWTCGKNKPPVKKD